MKRVMDMATREFREVPDDTPCAKVVSPRLGAHGGFVLRELNPAELADREARRVEHERKIKRTKLGAYREDVEPGLRGRIERDAIIHGVTEEAMRRRYEDAAMLGPIDAPYDRSKKPGTTPSP
jgi:hypothetical protein